MTVENNLLVGAYIARDEIKETMAIIPDLFLVLNERSRQETSTQSGGERQMISPGRALMTNPTFMLVNEPTVDLSPKVCLDIASALRRLNQAHCPTILTAMQKVNFALRLSQQMQVIETGEIKNSGPTAEPTDDPALEVAYFGT